MNFEHPEQPQFCKACGMLAHDCDHQGYKHKAPTPEKRVTKKWVPKLVPVLAGVKDRPSKGTQPIFTPIGTAAVVNCDDDLGWKLDTRRV